MPEWSSWQTSAALRSSQVFIRNDTFPTFDIFNVLCCVVMRCDDGKNISMIDISSCAPRTVHTIMLHYLYCTTLHRNLLGVCTSSLEESLRAIRGSVPWMAPEVIKQSGESGEEQSFHSSVCASLCGLSVCPSTVQMAVLSIHQSAARLFFYSPVLSCLILSYLILS